MSHHELVSADDSFGVQVSLNLPRLVIPIAVRDSLGLSIDEPDCPPPLAGILPDLTDLLAGRDQERQVASWRAWWTRSLDGVANDPKSSEPTPTGSVLRAAVQAFRERRLFTTDPPQQRVRLEECCRLLFTEMDSLISAFGDGTPDSELADRLHGRDLAVHLLDLRDSWAYRPDDDTLVLSADLVDDPRQVLQLFAGSRRIVRDRPAADYGHVGSTS